jgi:hypothetical protein
MAHFFFPFLDRDAAFFTGFYARKTIVLCCLGTRGENLFLSTRIRHWLKRPTRDVVASNGLQRWFWLNRFTTKALIM